MAKECVTKKYSFFARKMWLFILSIFFLCRQIEIYGQKPSDLLASLVTQQELEKKRKPINNDYVKFYVDAIYNLSEIQANLLTLVPYQGLSDENKKRYKDLKSLLEADLIAIKKKLDNDKELRKAVQDTSLRDGRYSTKRIRITALVNNQDTSDSEEKDEPLPQKIKSQQAKIFMSHVRDVIYNNKAMPENIEHLLKKLNRDKDEKKTEGHSFYSYFWKSALILGVIVPFVHLFKDSHSAKRLRYTIFGLTKGLLKAELRALQKLRKKYFYDDAFFKNKAYEEVFYKYQEKDRKIIEKAFQALRDSENSFIGGEE